MCENDAGDNDVCYILVTKLRVKEVCVCVKMLSVEAYV